jgi:hypothetical protein
MKNSLLSLIFFCILTTANSQITYTWNGGNGAWNVGGNWTPNGVPAANDIVQFNNGASQTVTNVSLNVTLGKIIVTGNTNVILQNTAARTLTVAAGTGTDLTVSAGCTLTMGTNISITLQAGATAAIDGTLIITNRTYNSGNAGSVTTVTGTIENSGGTVTGSTTGILFQSGSEYTHSRSGGNIPVAGWDAASTCRITGITSGDPGGDEQAFGNLIYDCAGMSGNRNTGAGLLSVGGNLEILNTGTGLLQLPLTSLTVGGDFIMGGGSFRIGNNTNRTIAVGGDMVVSGGTLLMSVGSNVSDLGTINVAGDFSQSGGLIDENNAGKGLINFNGTGIQLFLKTGGMISNTIDFAISSGATVDFGTSVLNGSGGSFTLNAGGKIATVNGLFSTGASGPIQVTGTRTFSSGGDYEFKGTSTGVFATSPVASTARDIIVNNTGGVALSQPMAVTRSLKLLNGELTTSSANLVTINDNATATGYSNTSFIVGPVVKKGNDDFEFPIGRSGAGLIPIKITGLSGASDFTAEYKRASSLTVGPTIIAAGLHHVSYCEYWTLARVGAATANVTLYWNTNSNCNAAAYVTDLSTIVVAHSNGTGWDDYGRNGGTTGTMSSGTVTWNNVNTFSPFALGSTTALANPLPVLFGDVKAYDYNNGIQIEWENLTEKNIVHYAVQRSANGRDFVDIALHLPKNNQQQKASYIIYDANPVQGVNYYRVKALETSGASFYSKSLRVEPGMTKPGLVLYPNPVVNGQLTLSLTGVKPGRYTITIASAAGQVLKQGLLIVGGNAAATTIYLPSTIKSGVNLLIVNGISYSQARAFVVQ